MIPNLVHASPPWEELPSLPVPTGGFISGTVDGKVVVLGGTNWEGGEKQWLKTAYQLDPHTLTWTTLAPLPAPLAYGLGGNVGHDLVVMGGTTGQSPWQGVVRVTAGGLTSTIDGGMTAPAVLSAGGMLGDELIVAGGTDDAANVQALTRSAFALALKTGTTRRLPDVPGPGLGVAAGAVAGSQFLMFAGATWDAETKAVLNLAEAYAFDPIKNAWRTLRPYPFTVRGLTAVALDERRVYLAGGYSEGGFTDQAFIYDVVRDTYTPARALPYRAQVGLVNSDGYVYCLGGEDRMKHRSAAAFRIPVTALVP